jgi:hypothetical protein
VPALRMVVGLSSGVVGVSNVPIGAPEVRAWPAELGKWLADVVSKQEMAGKDNLRLLHSSVNTLACRYLRDCC